MHAPKTWLMSLVLGSTLFAMCATAGESIKLYVAPDGNDQWSGRLQAANADRTDGPLASPLGARNAIRRLRAAAGGKLEQPIAVSIAGGAYYMTEPFKLEPQDSGTADAPVVYAAAEGQSPVLSGGSIITGWTPAANGRWTAKIADVAAGKWVFQQLFVNGRRCIRARSPNEGYFRIAKTLPGPKDAQGNAVARDRFAFKPGDLQAWKHLEDVQVVLMHSWETSIHRVKSIDAALNTVQFTAPEKEWWPIGLWEKHQRYYVENALELLDQPGEWHLDRETGVLTYFPRPGEQMDKAVVVAPRLVDLVHLAGNADKKQFVQYVALRGLTIRHGDWVCGPKGNSSTQAAVETPASVTVDGALHCAIESCDISHVGLYAVWFRRGCKDCRITHTRIYDMGAGGVRVGEAAMPKTEETETSRTLVDNNHIYDGGHTFAAGIGVWVGQSSHNVISHNEIHDLLYSGMSIGWNWGDTPTKCHYNTIEFNHVHHVMKGTLSDGAAIYCLGVSTGSVIRNNVFHDVWPYDQPRLGWGIYLDAVTSRYTVENNVVYNTQSGGMMYNNGGHEHVIRNNIFAFSGDYALWPFWEKRPTTFERNIIYMTQGKLFVPHAQSSLNERVKARQSLGVWDNNVYWDTAGVDQIHFFGFTLDQWRAMGLDAHSVIADPEFVGAADYDFRLKPTSQALKLGFQPIDTSTVGLYGDAAWVAEAKNLKYPKTVLPPPPPPPAPMEVDDDFEKTPVGEHPQDATVSGETSGASVAISDQQAAGGKHSIKVTDTKAVQPSWQPHFYYEPHLAVGVVRQSFDLRLSPGATLAVEWRDHGDAGYATGPHVTFDGAGKASAGGKTIAVPVDGWFHVEIEAAMGKSSPKTFKLTLTPPNAQPQTLSDLPMPSRNFTKVDWLGFISVGAKDATFFIDNLQIKKR
jgi:hypothetical protein